MLEFVKPIVWAIRTALAVAIVSLATVSSVASASEITLVMFESPVCERCQAWHAEVGDAYPITEEGKFAPLRRVQIYDKHPADLAHIRWPRFTPTFVMLIDGEEIGRIRGYPGEDFFWPMLGELIVKAKAYKKSN